MSLRAILLGIALACAHSVQPSGEGPKRFQLELPRRVDSRPTYLVLREVTIPANRAVILRVYALRADSGQVLLGSTAVPGVAPDARGVTVLRTLRINATAGLERWLAGSPSARRVNIEIVPVTPGDTTRRALSWGIRTAELVHPE
jgi:hypothetical protein